eukprot:scaffold12431_cov57-Attheya_sp.AAC.2
MESFAVATALGGTVLFVQAVVGNAVVLPVIVLLVIVGFVSDASAPPAELFLLANIPAIFLHKSWYKPKDAIFSVFMRKAVDLSHNSNHTTQQQTEDEETNPPTSKEIDEEGGSLSSIHENGRLFGDEDNKSEVDEDEIEIQFDIEAQDELLNAHESQDDAGLTDTGGVRVEVPKDPEIIPEGLGYDDIGIITDDMLDIVVPHSTADVVHSKLIDLLSQFSAPRYAYKAILDLMKEAHIDGFEFLV